jgi:hypothetical protein
VSDVSGSGTEKASASTESSERALGSEYFPRNVDVAAYLAEYPTLPPEAEYASWPLHARPIRNFQGMLDDVNTLAAARKFVEVQHAKGFDVIMFEYPNARHVFCGPP